MGILENLAGYTNLKRHYVINKLATQTHCRMKTYDNITGSS